MKIPFDTSEVPTRLLAWYKTSGRDLPWRQTRDPYNVWLSEIMLQQTTVAAVVPYYKRFLVEFPHVKALAEAEQEAVLNLWSGLGYYSRARNLHKAAQLVANEMDGEFPATVEGLLALPGVGRSTAGAIVSIAYDRPAPILDGNVRRVLVRLMALQEPPRQAAAEKKLWQWAAALTSTERPHDYGQAIMDLGATVCLPRNPHCSECPLQGICQARRTGLENQLPVQKPRKQVPLRCQVVMLVRRGDELLVCRRPPAGLLGGMWEFPCCEVADGEESSAALRKLLDNLGLTVTTPLGSIRHLYSHFRLTAEVFLSAAPDERRIAENDSFWHDAETLTESPLHGAHQKVLALLMKEEKR